MSTGLPTLRAVVVAVAADALAVGLAVPARTLVLGAVRDGASLDGWVATAVVALAATAGLVLAVGCTALAATCLLGAHRSRPLEALAARLTPALLRRAVTAGVGVALGLAGPTGAVAAELDLGWVATTGSATDGTAPPETSLAGGSPASVPDGQAAGPPAASPPRPGASLAAGDPAASPAVVVRPGDSLWSITAGRLGTDDIAAVAAEWPRWYAANSHVIGSDPDLIRPGQTLRAPEGAPDHERQP